MPRIDPRVHVVNLSIGERFAFEPGGPRYRRVAGPRELIWIEDLHGVLPPHELEYEGCLVYVIADEQGDHDEH